MQILSLSTPAATVPQPRPISVQAQPNVSIARHAPSTQFAHSVSDWSQPPNESYGSHTTSVQTYQTNRSNATFNNPNQSPAANQSYSMSTISRQTYEANKPYNVTANTIKTVQQRQFSRIDINTCLYDKTEPQSAESAHLLSQYENSWRSRFPKLPILIYGIIEVILTILIIILEIASLAVSTYSATGAGFWCSIPFMAAAIMTILLVKKWDRPRLWATRVLISQLVLLVFTFILIGIAGSFVSASSAISSLTYVYSGISYGGTYGTKVGIMQAQLAFGILLMFAGIVYIVLYGIITYLTIWKLFHTLDTPHLFRK
ncbi:hypothetical protein I4U23_019884 [Adineta vaga]|nr:hypothetical protein I4U23_019884 [Adineta vaga]